MVQFYFFYEPHKRQPRDTNIFYEPHGTKPSLHHPVLSKNLINATMVDWLSSLALESRFHNLTPKWSRGKQFHSHIGDPSTLPTLQLTADRASFKAGKKINFINYEKTIYSYRMYINVFL